VLKFVRDLNAKVAPIRKTADGEEWQLALEREAVIRPPASKSTLSVTLIEEAVRQLRLPSLRREDLQLICFDVLTSG
jgi:hypothetical protein